MSRVDTKSCDLSIHEAEVYVLLLSVHLLVACMLTLKSVIGML